MRAAPLPLPARPTAPAWGPGGPLAGQLAVHEVRERDGRIEVLLAPRGGPAPRACRGGGVTRIALVTGPDPGHALVVLGPRPRVGGPWTRHGRRRGPSTRSSSSTRGTTSYRCRCWTQRTTAATSGIGCGVVRADGAAAAGPAGVAVARGRGRRHADHGRHVRRRAPRASRGSRSPRTTCWTPTRWSPRSVSAWDPRARHGAAATTLPSVTPRLAGIRDGHRLRDEVLGRARRCARRRRRWCGCCRRCRGWSRGRMRWPAEAHVVGPARARPAVAAAAAAPGRRAVGGRDRLHRSRPCPRRSASSPWRGWQAATCAWWSPARSPGHTRRTSWSGVDRTSRCWTSPTSPSGPAVAGFTAKALSRGVPMVVVPLAGDQRETAGRGRAQWGRGVAGARGCRTPAPCARPCTAVLADGTHRAAAQRLARGAEGLGPAHAAEVVERALLGSGTTAAAP